jgi:crotonobetainyl-CoA:carnitine CoA-transferase CaiB-like acyl-CoA transferase
MENAMLKGIKVLSFTHFLQGPSAVQMLADIGADVVKIEPPQGAFERGWAGFDAFAEGVSIFFLLGNRNQRAIQLDLRNEKAKEIVRRLIQEADVLVENYRPGVLDKLGFGYQDAKAINPRLVYCSCTGYGSTGPYQKRPGQDLLLQAMSGMAMLSGDGESAPTPMGSAIVDQHAAVLAAFGILAALHQRQHTGEGCMVESNLLNAALDLQIEPFTYFLNKGPLWKRSSPAMGSRFHPAPYGVYRTADGWIAISLTTTAKLAAAFDSSELGAFSGPKDQVLHRDAIHQLVARALRERTTEAAMRAFDEQDIWYAPVNDYEQVADDAQVKHNGIVMEVEHPQAGLVRLMAHPVRYDGKTPAMRRLPPQLGEHTREVLADLGYSEVDIERLLAERVALAAQAPGEAA